MKHECESAKKGWTWLWGGVCLKDEGTRSECIFTWALGVIEPAIDEG